MGTEVKLKPPEKPAKRHTRETTEEANKRLKRDAGHEIKERTQCPYLSTINRSQLNFDNERKCSHTLQTLNIYMCLVCGEYMNGKSKGTRAYTHSLQFEHYMYIDMFTGQIWCIPDMYEVRDDSLSDIQHNLNPVYEPQLIEKLLTQQLMGHRVIDQTEYTVGYVGLNNIKLTDYMNAVLQALLHIPPLVRHYLQTFKYRKEVQRSPLRDAMSELFRKVWNPYNYVGHVSPRQLIEVVSKLSKGGFDIGKWEDPQKFMHFLITHLNTGERRWQKDRHAPTVIERVFQGQMRIESKEYRIVEGMEMDDKTSRTTLSEAERIVPFFTLPVSLPNTPLSKDESERNIVQQEHLLVLLQKYNGISETMKGIGHNLARGDKFVITKLPRYLVLFFERFTKEFGVLEKNRAIVNSPVVSLDMADFCTPEEAQRYSNVKYDLCSTIVHEGVLKDGIGGVFKTYQFNKQFGQWLDMEDLRVVKTEPQVVSVAEAYIQIWELQGAYLGTNRALYEKSTYDLICSFLPPKTAKALPVLCKTLYEKTKEWHEQDQEMAMDS